MSGKTNYVALSLVLITAVAAGYIVVRTARSIDGIATIQKNNTSTVLTEE